MGFFCNRWEASSWCTDDGNGATGWLCSQMSSVSDTYKQGSRITFLTTPELNGVNTCVDLNTTTVALHEAISGSMVANSIFSMMFESDVGGCKVGVFKLT